MSPHTRILLTGATGFLGSHLAYGLIAADYEVIAYRRNTSNLWRVADIERKIAWYDVTDLESPFREHGKIDHVIHTATIYGRNNEKNSLLVDTNLLFPLKLFEIASSFKANTFLNTDTILYKDINGYSLSKGQLREWLKMVAGQTKVINVKLEHIYGPKDDDSKFVTSIIKQCLSNIPDIKLTEGEQKRDFIYISDVVEGYLCLLKHHLDLCEPYLDVGMGSGYSIPIKDLVRHVAELTGTRTNFLFGALPYRKKEIMDSKADISLLRGFGWRPRIGLKDGLRMTIKAEKRLKHEILDNRRLRFFRQ